MAGGYDALAPLYERVFGPEAAGATWQALAPLLGPVLRPGSRVLELCCGTGEMTARLTRAGCRVTAVDRSAAMLAYARRRAPEAKFVASDVCAFRPRGVYDAAVCAYNSLPHITDIHKLGALFATVREALRPGGRFVFDLYPEDAVARRWHAAYQAGPCLLEASFQPRTALARTRVYWAGGSTELVIRRYTRHELARRLRGAGFVEIRRVRGEATEERMFWCCSTPAG